MCCLSFFSPVCLPVQRFLVLEVEGGTLVEGGILVETQEPTLEVLQEQLPSPHLIIIITVLPKSPHPHLRLAAASRTTIILTLQLLPAVVHPRLLKPHPLRLLPSHLTTPQQVVVRLLFQVILAVETWSMSVFQTMCRCLWCLV